MFQFLCSFAFINFLSFKPDIEDITPILTLSSKRAYFDEVQFF